MLHLCTSLNQATHGQLLSLINLFKHVWAVCPTNVILLVVLATTRQPGLTTSCTHNLPASHVIIVSGFEFEDTRQSIMYENTLRVRSRSASGHSQRSLDTVSLASSNSIVASTIWSMENETVRKVPRLNDQQWITQRKKIGLSRKIKSPKKKDKTKSKKEDIVSYIRNNFKRKECVNYVSNPSDSKHRSHAPCYCGATKKDHKSYSEYRQDINSVAKHPTIMEESEEGDTEDDNKHGIMINIEGPKDWKPSLSFREFPTNAFGNIEFAGRLSLGSKYVRISADSDIKKVKEFIVDQWEMMTPRPRLAIGIIGGAQNFKLEGRKQQIFKLGLIGALKVKIHYRY